MAPGAEVKKKVIEALVASLEKERLTYERIAAQSRLDAIDGEMKQEGKYDTRAIEAGYLAGAQKRRLEEIIVEIQSLKSLGDEAHLVHQRITAGSLVCVQPEARGAESQWYFLSPLSGGLEIEVGLLVKVVSLRSPIGQALVGLGVGEEPFKNPLPVPLRSSEILEIL